MKLLGLRGFFCFIKKKAKEGHISTKGIWPFVLKNKEEGLR